MFFLIFFKFTKLKINLLNLQDSVLLKTR